MQLLTPKFPDFLLKFQNCQIYQRLGKKTLFHFPMWVGQVPYKPGRGRGEGDRGGADHQPTWIGGREGQGRVDPLTT